jgi:putative Holliday junction resolvase
MGVCELRDVPGRLGAGQRLLGLDVGAKTIGMAISDGSLTVASPLDTIRRGKFSADAAAIGRVIAARDVGGLVVGLPVNMDGSEGRRCQSVRQFVKNVLEHIDISIAFWDERPGRRQDGRGLHPARSARRAGAPGHARTALAGSTY